MYTITSPASALQWQMPLARYTVSLVATADDLHAALRLRYEVFNLELHEGLAGAHVLREDRDAFDDVCDHLIVRDTMTNAVVGTYRLQTGASAQCHLGYYSEREFDFAPYKKLRSELVELGRACIHREHRSYDVLMLLWRGIAAYAAERAVRYFIGCSSLSTLDPASGIAAYRQLESHLAPAPLRTQPWPALRIDAAPVGTVSIPKLLRAYLSLGARICSTPAVDREFGTIDFLTLLDVQQLKGIRARLFGMR